MMENLIQSIIADLIELVEYCNFNPILLFFCFCFILTINFLVFYWIFKIMFMIYNKAIKEYMEKASKDT